MHRRIGIALTSLSALALLACGGDERSPSAGGASGAASMAELEREVLASVADGVILPTYRSFVTAAESLEEAAKAHAAAPDASTRGAAQEAWRAAMAVWQRAEALQVGPAGPMGAVAGGQSYRDSIYSWPTVNRCRVDQETARQTFADPAALAVALPNVRGLDALEHLLFSEGSDHVCSAGSQFALSGEWSDIGDAAAVEARRAAHAAAVASDLVASAKRLRDAWEPDQGNFRAAFAEAGLDTSVYATAHEALNGLTDALFYVEKETKDMKLAVPAGVSECETTTCPDERESVLANASLDHLEANVLAFEAVFLGGAPGGAEVGIDDLLVAVGQEPHAEELGAKLRAALAALDALDGSLADALASQPQDVVKAYDELREAMSLFKTQVVSVLDLELPLRVEGDND